MTALRQFIFILLLTGWLQEARAASVAVCELMGKAYQEGIAPKIESGVPFELASQLLNEEKVVVRRIFHVKFDLWNEIVTVSEREKVIARFPLQKAKGELCTLLGDLGPLPSGRLHYQLLLNPMWDGRIARLKSRAANESGLLKVDWGRLANQLPSESVLLETEVKL